MGTLHLRHITIVGLVITLGACATVGDWRQDAVEVETCLADYRAIDAAVNAAGTGDAEYARIEGFPYFRIDRFLASYEFKSFDAAQRTAWIDRLVARDLDGRSVEIGNLPPGSRAALEAELGGNATDRSKACSATLRAFDHRQKSAHRALPPRVRVPDNYSSGLRLAGFYPLSALAVNFGFSRWKANYLPVFDKASGALPVKGRLRAYAPAPQDALTPTAVKDLVDASRGNALNIPEPKGDDAGALITAFAPVWQIDTASDDDLIGTPGWRGTKTTVDTGQPRTYVRFSHAHWQGRVLLQINYMIWFPSRPKQSSFDALGGHIDGVTWRVTIGPDGRPLAYDAIHNCGCYHLFFPAPGLQAKPATRPSPYYEGTVIAANAPVPAPGERLVIRLASTTHYLQHVGIWEGASDITYPMADYHDLRRLPAGERTRSLYGPDGIVKGTERGERYWLWAMGIKNPGAMRQWGNHATAFVGRRHFDDPWLLEETFEPAGAIR